MGGINNPDFDVLVSFVYVYVLVMFNMSQGVIRVVEIYFLPLETEVSLPYAGKWVSVRGG